MMNTEQGNISVIVPVYNVEPYLRRCIDSILAQTYTNFKLILIDDGSPDNCGVICQEYAMQDDRIMVIHKENGGLSAARNTGIEWVFDNSNSQWITFIDSDDCIRPQMLEHLYNAVADSGLKLSIGGLCIFSKDPNLEKVFDNELPIQVVSGRDICKSLYRNEYTFNISAWGKLYHRDLFREFRFPVGKIHEDQNLVPRLLYTAEQVAVLPSPYYCYRSDRPDSIMNEDFSIRRFDNIDGITACIHFYESKGDDELILLATDVKERMRNEYLLAAWKRGMGQQVPQEHKPTFLQGCKILVEGIWNKCLKKLKNMG